jgi:hypothetical protein
VGGIVAAVIAVFVGLMQEGRSTPVARPELPVIPSAFAGLPTDLVPRPGPPASGVPGLPGAQLPGAPLPFASLLPRLPPSVCLLMAETRPGRGLSRAERREADAATGDFLCGLALDDVEAAFAGTGTPSATQRSRFKALEARGPFGPVTIVDVDTGSAGRRRVTAVFQTAPGVGGRRTCWRSRLTVARSGDEVSSMTAPVRVRCL